MRIKKSTLKFLILSILFSAKIFCDSKENTKDLEKLRKSVMSQLTHVNKLVYQGKLEEPIAAYKKAAALFPNTYQIWYNLAYILRIKGDANEAAKAYEKSIELVPENEDAQFGLAKAYLAAGQFKKGWEKFEYRYNDVKKFRVEKIDPHTLKGKRVLLMSEWGLGDMMQFIRYAKLVKNCGATVMVETLKPLMDLFSQCEYIDELYLHGRYPQNYDTKISMMSLPYLFDTTIDTVPAPIPYLHADKKLEDYWKEKLKKDKNFRVGLCWHAKPIHLEEQPRTRRSVPLKQFAPLSEIEGLSFYSLQQIHGVDQLDDLPDGFVVHTFDNNFDKNHGRFMDTAAVIKNLDLVISVDTSIVHLAGALGKQIWVLIPHTAEWRWMNDREDTPWYPNVRLFRQPQPGDWDSVIEKIKDSLDIIAMTNMKLQGTP